MRKVLQLFLHRRFIKHISIKKSKPKQIYCLYNACIVKFKTLSWDDRKVTCSKLHSKMPMLPCITAVHLLGASSLTWPPTGKLRRRLTLTSDPGATLMVSFFSGSFPGFKMSDNFIVRLSTVSLGKITGSWSKKKS